MVHPGRTALISVNQNSGVLIQGDLKCATVVHVSLWAWEPYCSAWTRDSELLQSYVNAQLVSSSFLELKGVLFWIIRKEGIIFPGIDRKHLPRRMEASLVRPGHQGERNELSLLLLRDFILMLH